MATTISTDSPKLTADVASRAEIYGGRGLVFDGVSDYLDLPSSSLFNHSGNYSISVWIKKIGQPNSNVDTNANPTIIAKGNVYFTLFVNHDGMLGTFFYNSSNATDYNIKTADGVIQLNVWHHVVLTWNNTSSQLYVDGKQEYSGSYTPYNLNTGVNGTAVKIGDKESPTADTKWHGNMCDMKIFDSHITEAQVTELYLKPENTPNAIQDSIVAWYPMSEANPESPQSIVYDHSEKGKLGSEFVTNGDMSNLADASSNGYAFIPSSGWGFKHSTNSGGNATQFSQSDNGALRIFSNRDGIDYYTVGASVAITTGVLYKLTFDAKTNDASKTNLGLRYSNGSNMAYGNNGLDVGVTLTTSFQTFTYYFVPNADSNGGRAIHFGRTANTSVGHTNSVDATIDNVSVKEILMGQNATTNFFGNELITNGTFEANSNWTTAGAINSARVSSPKPVHSGTYAWSFEANSQYDGIYGDTYTTVTGKTYAYDLWVYPNDGTSIQIKKRNGANNADFTLSTTALTQGQWNNITGTYVETTGGTGAYLSINSNTATSGVYYVDDVSVKEVGVSSTGFTTAQEEPTIPQVPLLRYNEKMVFDGVDDKVVLDGAISALATQHGTINLWCIPHPSSSGSEDNLFTYNSSSARTDLLYRYDWNNNRIHIGIAQSGTQKWYAYSASSSTVHKGTMNMITLTHNGTTAKLYVNGIELSLTFETDTDRTYWLGDMSGVNKCSLGMWQYTSDTNAFNGIIDDVSYFNTALSATEVQELFNDGVAYDATTHSKSGNLLGYWRNDDVTTWQDRRGYSFINFDGTADNVQNTSFTTHQTNTGTISGWFIFNDLSGTQRFFGVGGNALAGQNRTLGLSGASLQFLGYGADWDTTVDLVAGALYHLAITWNGDDIVVYVNGTGYSQTLSALVTPTGTNFRIGENVWNGGDDANIKCMSASVYTATLSTSEIQSIYNNGHLTSEVGNSNIAHYWKMNNGSTVVDLVGSKNLTVNNATLNSGNNGTVAGSPASITIREGLNSNKDGLGFPLKNADSNVIRVRNGEHVNIGNTLTSSSLPATNLLENSFTMSAWIKPDDGRPSATSIFIGSTADSGWTGYTYFRLETSGAIHFIYGTAIAKEHTLTSSVIYDDKESTWKHLTVTFEMLSGSGTSGATITIYDGATLAGGGTHIGTDASPPADWNKDNYVNTVDLAIGATILSNGTISQPFNGLIDEVMMYNKVLSTTEILKNYKHGKGKHKND